MELAIIAPPKMLELSALVEPGFHMVLPEGLAASEDYVRFYYDCEGYKILDNGLVEGRQYTGVELHHMAYQVGAHCIVVPDQYRDAGLTIRMAQDFSHSRNEALEYMGVLQGLDLTDIFQCLKYFNEQEWITHIGLPRIICDLHKLQRVVIVQHIKAGQEAGHYRPFKIHALGGSPWIREIVALDEAGCDSMDTSLPVVLGLEGLSLSHDYIRRSDDFMERDVDRNTVRWRVLLDNCRQFLGWAGYESDQEKTP